jgi:ACS family glucarate transporter-like MFS transporter
VSLTADPSRPAEHPTSVRHLVLAALLAITMVNYVQRNAIAPAATTIEEKLGVSSPQLDLAAGAFFLAYTLLQVPSGWLAQRWGSRLMLSFYAAGWSLALIYCARASGFFELYLGRLAMGALQAGIFPCATLILQVWYPATQRGLATALLNSFMLLGSAGGVMLAGKLLGPLGWRGVFLCYAVPGLIWSVWFLWWFRNRPEEHPGVNQAERDLLAASQQVASSPATPEEETKAAVHPARTWLLILGSLPLLLLCTQQCFRAAASRLLDSRLPTYLERQRGQTKEDAATLSSYPQWAGMFGGLFGGALSDVILRRSGSRRLARNGVALLSLASATAVFLLAWFIADVKLAVLVFSAGFFLFSFSSPCAYALSIDIGGKYLAIVFGLMNMLGNLGAFAFVSSVTTLVRLGGWELALGVWLMLHVAAFFCWLFLDPDVAIGEPASVRCAE